MGWISSLWEEDALWIGVSIGVVYSLAAGCCRIWGFELSWWMCRNRRMPCRLSLVSWATTSYLYLMPSGEAIVPRESTACFSQRGWSAF